MQILNIDPTRDPALQTPMADRISSTPLNPASSRRLRWYHVPVMALMVYTVLTLPIQYGWKNYTHVRNWTLTSAEVSWLGELCEMHETAGKNSWLRDVIDCKDVRPWRVANKKVVNGRQRYFRSTLVDYAIVLINPANGPVQKVKVRQSVASRDELSVGSTIEIFYNPEDPSELDRAYRWYEYKFSILYYLSLIWVVWRSVRWVRRERRKLRYASSVAGAEVA